MNAMPQESYDPSIEPPRERPRPSSSVEEKTIDLHALWNELRAGKRTILVAGVAGFVLVAAFAFLLIPNYYTATATFIVPSSSGSGLSAIGDQLSLMGAGALSGSLKNPGEVDLGILESASVARDMVARFNLQKIYGAKKVSVAMKILASQSSFDLGTKNGIITINVTNRDPKLACDMANAYLDEFRNTSGRLALTESSQRRLFFEQQMGQEKDALENAEVDLKKTEEQTGIIAVAPQTTAEIQAASETRAQITGREVELAGLLQGSTEQDPEVIRLRSEIASLKEQLARMADGGENDLGNAPSSKFPEAQLEYVRKQREVSYHEALFQILARQYEAARLDESHDAPVVQVLDQAVVPDTKSGPHRSLYALGGMLAGILGAMAWILLRSRLLHGLITG